MGNMSRTELNKGYRASARIEELWKRAQAQPDEMFLPMLRALFYLDGWMAAKNEGLPMRNAAALCHVIDMHEIESRIDEGGDAAERRLHELHRVRPIPFRRRHARTASSRKTRQRHTECAAYD